MNFTNTYLSNTIELTDKKARYDNCAKAIMADKQVLARIAKHTTKEFKGYDIPTIIQCIEGNPEISTIPVHPGMKKKTSEAIDGMKEESAIPNEGTITFDIRFNMVTLDEIQIKIILNIELQNEYYESYHFEPRAVFYCARMISEQLDHEFSADNYDNLKKVYSIWIFFNPPQKDSNTITEYSLEKKDTYGKPVKGWNHDYISIVFIRLSSIPGVNSQHQLISMLDTLFSNKLSTAEKKTILEQEHQMKMTRQLEGGTNLMCNLSDGIYNQGIEQGIQQGIEKGIEKGTMDTLAELIKKKLDKGMSAEAISEILEIDLSTVLNLIEEYHL